MCREVRILPERGRVSGFVWVRGRVRCAGPSVFLDLGRWVILAFLLLAFFLGSGAAAQASLTVEWKEGHLSVIAEQAPLVQILREVARLTGLEVRGLEWLQNELFSARFSGLPLREGLLKLLAELDHMLVEETSPQEGVQPVLALVFGRRSTRTLEALRGEERTTPKKEPAVEEAPEEHFTALDADAEQGDEEALQKAVFDPDQIIQTTAFERLAQRDSQKAVALLVGAAQSEQLQTRLQALQLFHHTGYVGEETVLSALGAALADEDVTVKTYAIQALAERGGAAAMGHLRQAFRDPDPSVRKMVVEHVIQTVETEQSLPLLKEAVWDNDEMIRATAASWLEQTAEGG